MKILTSRLMIAALVAGALFAATPAQDAQQKDGHYYFVRATEAYKAKDYAAFLENMKAAVNLRPGHPGYVYNTACAFALAGKPEEALAWLEKFAAMGMIGDVEKDTDLDSLKALPRFREVLGKIAANREPSGGSETVFTVSAKGLVPEGVAFDPVTKTFFLSSAHDRKIMAVGDDGKVRDFSSASDGLFGALGLRVDAKRRRLWVASASFPEIPGYDKAAGRRSAVFEYDLSAGKLVKRYALPEGSPHILGDLVVASNGDVYASDSASPIVYVLRVGKDALEVFAQDPAFLSLQGIALSPDEKTMFLADYSRGIITVDMATKRATVLPTPDATTVLGIDGLYFHDGSLVGIQNGTTPHRIIRLTLGKDYSRVERVSVVAANDPAWDEPTLGVVVDGTLYYNAVSQWGNVGEGGQFARQDALRDARVMKVKISGQ